MATFIAPGHAAHLKDGTILGPEKRLTADELEQLKCVSVPLVDTNGDVVREADDTLPRRRIAAIRRFQAGEVLSDVERALLDDETWDRLQRERAATVEREAALAEWREAGS